MATRTHARLIALSIASAVACATGSQTPPPDPMPDWLYTVQDRPYLLESGDVVQIEVYTHPRLSTGDLTIQPDGRLRLMLLGHVEARGRSVSQFKQHLLERYQAIGVVDPEVSVRLKQSAGLRVFVGGQVGKPGMVSHDGTLTLMSAIVRAGGLTAESSVGHAIVLRDPGNGEAPLIADVDLHGILDGDVPAPPLQSSDVVFLPRSKVSKANLFIEQYIVRMIPFSSNFTFLYTTGNSNNNN